MDEQPSFLGILKEESDVKIPFEVMANMLQMALVPFRINYKCPFLQIQLHDFQRTDNRPITVSPLSSPSFIIIIDIRMLPSH